MPPIDLDHSEQTQTVTPSAASRVLQHKRLQMREQNGMKFLDLGSMEIWDGADLALIRDALYFLIAEKGHRSIGVQMQYVKYIPSGFFGMLSDWHDQGVEIRLYSPQPNVREMLWFRRFFQAEAGGMYRLNNALHQVDTSEGVCDWESSDEDWVW